MAQKRGVFFFALLATVLFYSLLWNGAFLKRLDDRLFDLLDSALANERHASSTVIVAIDEKSLDALGQWPWPRIVMAELIRKIGMMEPSATALDVLFPEQDRTSPEALENFYRRFFDLNLSLAGLPGELGDNDRLLAGSIEGTNLTVAVFFTPEVSQDRECFLPAATTPETPSAAEALYEGGGLLCNLPILQRAAQGAGHIQASPDGDGILRRLALFIRYGDRVIPTLGMAAALTVDDALAWSGGGWSGDVAATILGHKVRGDRQSQVLLRFYPKEQYRVVSAIDVLQGEVSPELLRGKFVFVGATAMGLYDRYTLSDGSMLPGVYAHATLLENMLDDALVSQPDGFRYVSFGVSLLIGTALMVLMWSKRYLWLLVLVSSSAVVAVAVAYALLRQNLYSSVGYFLIPLGAYLFAFSVALFLIDYRDRKRFYEKMSKANEAMIDSMALVAETRDAETGSHIFRTKTYIRLLANALAERGHYREVLTPEYITDLYHAAPLHDVGKVGIPDAILKKPGPLTPEEFEVMKTHTTIGKQIIANAMRSYKNTSMLEIAHNIAASHHEKWDGSGYPLGLRGEAIALEGRLMALVDVYDALISRRCYKEPFGFERAESIITQARGHHFDPVLVDAFLELRGEFRAIAQQNGVGA